jgi:hypothetical protein
VHDGFQMCHLYENLAKLSDTLDEVFFNETIVFVKRLSRSLNVSTKIVTETELK